MNINCLLIKKGEDIILTKKTGLPLHHWSMFEFPVETFFEETEKMGVNPIFNYSRLYSIPVEKQSGTRNVYVAAAPNSMLLTNRGIAVFSKLELEELKGSDPNPFRPLLNVETYTDLKRLGYI